MNNASCRLKPKSVIYRAAFTWSRGNGDIAAALQLASALQPLWSPGRMREGLAGSNPSSSGKATVSCAGGVLGAGACGEGNTQGLAGYESPMGRPTSSRRLHHLGAGTRRRRLRSVGSSARRMWLRQWFATRKPLNPTSPRRSSWRAPLTIVDVGQIDWQVVGIFIRSANSFASCGRTSSSSPTASECRFVSSMPPVCLPGANMGRRRERALALSQTLPPGRGGQTINRY